MPRSSGPRPVRITVTRYMLAGKQVPKGTPGATRAKSKSETYYANLKVDGSKVRTPLETTDLATAWKKLREILQRQLEQSQGIRDEFTDHAGLPLGRHISEWVAEVSAKGTGEVEVGSMKSRVEWIAAHCGWKRVGDITTPSCLEALAHLQNELDRSAQTRNHYTRHAKQFTRWLVDNDRLRRDPLRRLKRVTTETDRRHDRRVPTDDEITRLMAHLESPAAPIRRRMTGPQRALGYRLCMGTGLRAGELSSLRRDSFDLEAGTVTVTAAYDKRRRKVTLPLPPWLTAELRAWFATERACWEGFPREFPGRLLKADLAAAGVPYSIVVNGTPLFFDFHSLRHHYCTWAASHPGISPKTLMELCRHSTPALTMKIYAKAKEQQMRATVEAMPRPGADSSVATPVAAKVAPERVARGNKRKRAGAEVEEIRQRKAQ